MKRRFLAGMAIAVTAAVAAPLFAAPATASTPTLAGILTSDGNRFDTNPNDFDIVTEAVIALGLASVANDPAAKLTVFLPTDFAMRRLVRTLTGKTVQSEEAIFNALAASPLLDRIVKYHIINGAAIDFATARANKDVVTMFSGDTLRTQVRGRNALFLVDGATRVSDPRVIVADIRASNGIAHGISRVLLPINP